MVLFEEKGIMTDSVHRAMPCDGYTYDELADVYSRAREDYIVPMPMNGRRMKQYVTAYDVDLSASFVAVDIEDNVENGVCMLGVRNDCTWITRLGVIPARRRRRSGHFLMDAEIEKSRQLGVSKVQLEVIKGNEPAHRLFTKLGFEVTRELLIIRRAPSTVDDGLIPEMDITPIGGEKVFALLEGREPNAAWTEQTASLRNAGQMEGLQVELPDGELGWVVYQRTPFQLGHFVLQPDVSDKMIQALIAAVHTTNPLQDTKIENVPSLHPSWDVFQRFGYVIAFERIEMILAL